MVHILLHSKTVLQKPKQKTWEWVCSLITAIVIMKSWWWPLGNTLPKGTCQRRVCAMATQDIRSLWSRLRCATEVEHKVKQSVVLAVILLFNCLIYLTAEVAVLLMFSSWIFSNDKNIVLVCFVHVMWIVRFWQNVLIKKSASENYEIH